MIGSVDEFILYDDMQYTRRDWRNRNQIKTAQGLLWLTVPVKVKGKYLQTIRETEIDGQRWRADHWKALQQNYRRAPYFEQIAKVLEPYYLEREFTHLSELNRALTEAICTLLGITTTLKWSWDYTLAEGKTERLVNLCRQAGATIYISGPAARDYIVAGIVRSGGYRASLLRLHRIFRIPAALGRVPNTVSACSTCFSIVARMHVST
jgi:WbqC-like protein family.